MWLLIKQQVPAVSGTLVGRKGYTCLAEAGLRSGAWLDQRAVVQGQVGQRDPRTPPGPSCEKFSDVLPLRSAIDAGEVLILPIMV